ncbi:ribosome maturation factor RimM [Gracilibacillus marinus]|jgi:16S rRNA processing protein RimM|uniref:Ribosome maturation factor RimM n=1 Tax=Gracilibacillus marinus TaxID=630535 RepID=A0ABV8VSD6_9BACI
MNEYLKVGKIVNTHGIRGEVRIIRNTDFDERFDIGSILYIKQNGTDDYIEVKVVSHRLHKQFDLVQFDNLTNINDVEKYKGSLLYVSKSNLIPLTEHEYYYYEIIGCEVVTESGERIGKVKEILSTGANDVWVTKSDEGKEYLIPYIEQVVKKVSVEDKTITINPMEGLLD